MQTAAVAHVLVAFPLAGSQHGPLEGDPLRRQIAGTSAGPRDEQAGAKQDRKERLRQCATAGAP